MAETLGSLVDKLSIKAIRETQIKKRMGRSGDGALQKKLDLLKAQKKLLLKEIDTFVADAAAGRVALQDQKLKLYNKPEQMNRIPKLTAVSRAIEALTKKNLEMWQLEDEARREDKPLSYIGGVKRKIDAANQQRNDLIDKIDELLMEAVTQKKPGKRR